MSTRPARKAPARRGELPKKTASQKARARRIYKALLERYPDAHCELDFRNPHELLVAVILSAQATDVSVNKVTPALFERFPTPADYAAASPAAIEPYVKSIGLFRNKARAIHAAMSVIAEQHGGQVPRTMDELLALRGVARKTANVVLGNAFGINEGVVVDTHVSRLAVRYGLTEETDPAKIERDLMALFPRGSWTMLSHLLIFHGRRVCKARGGGCVEDAICRRYCSNARAAAPPGPRSRRPVAGKGPAASKKAAGSSKTAGRPAGRRKTGRKRTSKASRKKTARG